MSRVFFLFTELSDFEGSACNEHSPFEKRCGLLPFAMNNSDFDRSRNQDFAVRHLVHLHTKCSTTVPKRQYPDLQFYERHLYVLNGNCKDIDTARAYNLAQ